MTSVEIIRVSSQDLLSLQKISQQTFIEAFAAVNTAANMKKYLDEKLSVEQLQSEINDTNTEFYFAILDENIIGYLKLNFGASQTEIKADNTVEIERIYVQQNFLGKNIGQQLFQKAVDIAREKLAAYIWLAVWEENKRAIQFYKKNGLIAFGQHKFQLGDDLQTDLMMKLELQ